MRVEREQQYKAPGRQAGDQRKGAVQEGCAKGWLAGRRSSRGAAASQVLISGGTTTCAHRAEAGRGPAVGRGHA